jgi:hypothetical protein
MALFTDGISTIQDLTVQDSSVLATAQTENIDLSQKLTLAQQELGIEITALLQQRSNTCDWQFWLQPDLQLNNIVVTPPLQFWHVFQTLMLTYQDAYFNQLNDRYQGKRDQFQQLAKLGPEQAYSDRNRHRVEPHPTGSSAATDVDSGWPAGHDLLRERVVAECGERRGAAQ